MVGRDLKQQRVNVQTRSRGGEGGARGLGGVLGSVLGVRKESLLFVHRTSLHLAFEQ